MCYYREILYNESCCKIKKKITHLFREQEPGDSQDG